MTKDDPYHYFTYGSIIPITVAFGTVALGRDIPNNLYFLSFNLSQPIKALILGAFVTIAIYIIDPLIIKSNNLLSKAILLGLLSAEVMVFTDKNTKTKMATITLLLFFYYHGVEHEK